MTDHPAVSGSATGSPCYGDRAADSAPPAFQVTPCSANEGPCKPSRAGCPTVHPGCRFLAGDELHHLMGVSCFAERVVVNENAAVLVPDGVPPEVAAISACAVITGVGAVFHEVREAEGRPLLVLGAGGVGLSSVMGAALVGAHPVIVVDIDDAKLDLRESWARLTRSTPARGRGRARARHHRRCRRSLGDRGHRARRPSNRRSRASRPVERSWPSGSERPRPVFRCPSISWFSGRSASSARSTGRATRGSTFRGYSRCT